MRARIATAASLMVLSVGLPVALGACGGGDDTEAQAATEKDFDHGNFSNPTEIDNKWFPLTPGMQLVYEGRSNRGHGRLPHRVITTVTDFTKEIDGVKTVVLWDQDINAGKILEGELAFFAQDDDNNVWGFGEYPEEYDENGRFEAAPDTWIVGQQGAKAGIAMRGDPQVGAPAYRQGVAPKIGFQDTATVYKEGQKSCVPTGCYDDVLVTRETNPTEPDDGFQLKYYASGVGSIRAEPRGGKEKEVLVLVETTRLSPAEMAKVRKEALTLDKRAYRTRKAVYGSTPPIEQAP